MVSVDKKLLSLMRKAVNDYKMIDDGDKIAVGLSGGKDSLTLLLLLKAYQRFSKEKFSLNAITIDLGFKDSDFSPLIDYCKEIEVDYHIEHTDLAEIIFDIRKEPNPCSLCSKMRRGALNSVLINKGFNKLALGHHADDLVETFFLSLFFEGRLSTFSPTSYMDRSKITLIRPMIYLEEKNINSFSKNLPIIHNPCPSNHQTQRENMKNLIRNIQKDIPFAKDRIFKALTNPERNNLWQIVDKP